VTVENREGTAIAGAFATSVRVEAGVLRYEQR
jgi:hypothetical protein